MNKIIITLIIILTLNNYIESQSKLHNIDYLRLGFNPKIGQPCISAMTNVIINPFTYNNNDQVFIQGSYWVSPDNVYTLAYPYVKDTSTTEIYTTSYVLEQSMSASFSTSYNPWFIPGMYSESSIENFFHKSTTQDFSYVATTSQVYTVFKSTYKSLNFTDTFLEELNKLPTVFNSRTCSKFNNFFDIFGTHYVASAIFGGTMSSLTSFSMSLMEEYTYSQIINAINTQFLLMSSSSTLSAAQQKELDTLNIYFDSEFMLVGGYAYEYNTSDSQKWQETIIQEPVFTSLQLVGYNTINSNKALEEAIINYFYSSYYGYGKIGTTPSDLLLYWPKNYAIIDNNIYFMSGENNYKYGLESTYFSSFTRGPLINWRYYTCAANGKKIYCFGGQNIDYYQKANINIYDTVTESWSIIPMKICYFNQTHYDCNVDSNFDFYNATAVSVNNIITIFGGTLCYEVEGNSNYCSIQVNYYFNVDTEMMMIVDPNYDTYTGDYFTPGASYQSAIHVGDATYLFAPLPAHNTGQIYGCNAGNYSSQVWRYYYGKEYDSGKFIDSWEQMTSMPEVLINFATTTIEERNLIYVAGGYNPYTNKYNEKIYEFNVKYNTWSIIEKPLETGSMGIGIFIKDFYYYFGGTVPGFPLTGNTVQLTSWIIDTC